jgi:hypothetical protein
VSIISRPPRIYPLVKSDGQSRQVRYSNRVSSILPRARYLLCDKANLDCLRLVIIIAGYLLLRPILVRYGTKLQERHHEKEGAKSVSKDVVAKENKQDIQDRADLRWGAGATTLRQRKAAVGHIQDGDSSDELDKFKAPLPLIGAWHRSAMIDQSLIFST